MKSSQHPGNYWAMWWGISLGLVFLAAATIGFALDRPSQNERIYAVQKR
jgi:hypothetical protein